MRQLSLLLPGLLAAGLTLADERPLPIIDMHLHAFPVATDEVGPNACVPPAQMPAWDQRRPYPEQMFAHMAPINCSAEPAHSAADGNELMQASLEVLERRNIFAVTSGPVPVVDQWRAQAPARIIPAVMFGLDGFGPPASIEEIRAWHAEGRIQVMGEVLTQYEGIAPDDERLAPYWALAEELDLPVALHVGIGPPGAMYLDSPNYRLDLSSALTLDSVLRRHPGLRLYLMHAGFPMLDDLLALMHGHPQVYVDVGAIAFGVPRAHFHRYLQALVEAGFGNRVMFGSDQMVWPGLIEISLRAIEDAAFLSEEQKRDILYNNAARFLRLSDADIARHHAGGS
ncbi:MAG: amidohydrolase family protein [Wenzhouxiangella sp.]|nr:amidohydrolase family protein [Wenzhouxiangella sp.]